MLKKFVLFGIMVCGLAAMSLEFGPQSASAMSTIHCAGGPSPKTGTGPYYSAGVFQIDPIVSRGSTMSMHEHMFYGFTEWQNLAQPYNAQYSDLVGKKTSCNVKVDSAAYWTPTLRYKSTGELVPILRSEAYYRAWDGKLTDVAKTTRPFPADLRMVAGNPMAMSEADVDTSLVAWSCSNTSTKSARAGYRYASPESADCSTAQPLPIPKGLVALTVAVKYPTCWDGKLNNHLITGNTADFSGDGSSPLTQHLAYRLSTGVCPAGFPKHLPELTYITTWSYNGDGSDVAVSSGMGDSAGKGYTWHADFFNAWPKTAMSRMVTKCINTSLTDQQVHEMYRDICGIPVLMKP